MRKALKYIVSPILLVLILVTYNAHAFRHWIMFLRYGGEWITYTKDDAVTIKEIYNHLKSQEAAE